MARSHLTDVQMTAWATVTGHLRTGRIDEAAVAAMKASARTDWSRFGRFEQTGPAALYPSDQLPAGWGWFEPHRFRALIARGPFERWAHHKSWPHSWANSTIREMQDIRSGPVFVVYDEDDWYALDARNDARLVRIGKAVTDED